MREKVWKAMKKPLTSILVVVLVLALGLGGYEYFRSARLEKNIAGLKDEVAGLKADRKADAARIEGLNKDLDRERDSRERLDAENNQLHSQNAAVIAERDEYKRQIQQMTDIQLATEIGKRVGEEEVGVVVSGKYRFSLTRVGGERTVGIFKDAETYFTLAQNQAKEITNLNTKVGSLENSIKIEQVKTGIEHDGRVKAETTLDKAMGQLTVLTSRKKWNRWLGRLEGVGVAILTFLLVEAVHK